MKKITGLLIITAVACLIPSEIVAQGPMDKFVPVTQKDFNNPDPNATIRSLGGVKGGLARKIGVGDVIINSPGTPHWLSEIEGEIEYVEIRVPNVDPAPGIERAEIAPGKAK